MKDKSNKINEPILPQAIYFDTNSLRQFIYSFANSNFLELKEKTEIMETIFCVPRIVLDETKHYYNITITNWFEKYETSAKELIKYLRLDDFDYPKPNNINDTINTIILNNVDKSKIQIVEKPEIDIDKLIEMAIYKTPPFEEKKEKGFRDSIIYLTILNHAMSIGFKNIFLITGDKIFSNKEVIKQFEDRGISLVVLNNMKETIEYIDTNISIIVEKYYKKQVDKMTEFLNKQKDTIFNFLINNIEVSESYFKSNENKLELSVINKVIKINSTTPKEIIKVFLDPIMFNDPIPKGKNGVTFSVKTEFNLLAEKIHFPYFDKNTPKIKIAETDEFPEVQFNFQTIEPENILIYKEIMITAYYTENDKGFDNLELLKVHTY